MSLNELVKSATCCLALTFRLKIIRPHGAVSRRNARSLAEMVNPAKPVMKDREGIGAD